MAKIIYYPSLYDLKQTFKDKFGNTYSRPLPSGQATSENLKSWIRPDSSGPSLDDLSDVANTANFISGSTISRFDFSGRSIEGFTCDSGVNRAAQITGSNGSLDFSTLPDGTAPTTGINSDRPFSVSMWLKADVPAATAYLFNKGSYYATYEIGGSGNVMRFYVTDGSVTPFFGSTASVIVSKFFSVSNPGGEIFNNNPTHLVFTYDGLASGSADINQTRKGTKIFINGARDTTTSHSNGDLLPPYSGMVPDFSQPLCIGTSGSDGTARTLDGQIAEFAVWDKELTDEEVKAIYNATRKPQVASGIDTNPARILLQERDSATGSYPTIARTGDPDFTGQYASTFDDTNTIIFSGGNLVYPTNLPASSKFVSGGVATPNILQGLTAAGTSSAGTADAHVSFTPGENISPFDESRIYLDNDSQFYATGTASGTLPGFSQRLGSKTSFSFSYSTPDPTVIFFATNSLGDKNPKALGAGSGVGYFNFERSQWEMLEPENVDCYASGAQDRQKSVFCFQPDNGYTLSTDDRVVRNVGLPVSDYGFPVATQYNATGSQCLEASSFLTDPFLLEKIRIHVSGIFGLNALDNDNTPFVKQFFVLNQSTPANSNVSSSFDQVNYITGVGYVQQYQRQGLRDLVAWGNVSFTRTTSDFDGNTIWDTDISVSANETNIQRGHTGSFTMELVPRIATFSEGLGSFAVREQGGELGNDTSGDRELSQLRNNLGSRDLRGSSSGRSFIKSIPGSIVSASITLAGMSSFGERGKAFIPNTPYETSPYVLMPNDRLVFGWNSHPRRVGNSFSIAVGANPGEEEWTRFADEISSFKVELFGSLLQNNLPKESETNQPLTSDAVHEDLHYSNPVYDQWDVEPFAALTGSYTDLVITGSILAQNSSGEYADPEAPNVRKVQASVAAGQAGTTGSLQRFVRLTAQKGKVYDSYPPNAVEVIQGAGFGILDYLGALNIVSVGAPVNLLTDSYGIFSGSDSDWYMRHAYEVSSQRFLRDSFKNVRAEAFDVTNVSQGTKEVTAPFTAIIYFSGSVAGPLAESLTIVGDGFGNSDNAESFKNTQKYLFGFGDLAYNLPSPILPEIGGTSAPLIRGYKYGLGGLFGSLPDARFRRDRYGQFRDMLEPRRFPATLVGGIVEYPVEIKFVPQDSTTGGSEDPARTHSQNLSPFATSSLPYYDGQVKDRADNPDITLTPIEVSV